MPVKLIALYRTPTDPTAFMTHYESVHIPLVKQTPHLVQVEYASVSKVFAGDKDLFLMTEMTYPDMAAFGEAMRSEQNRVVAADLANLHAEVTMFVTGT